MGLHYRQTTIIRNLLFNGVISSPLVPESRRRKALRATGLNISPCTKAGRSFFGGANITTGDGAFINYGAFLDSSATITIGSGCVIAAGAVDTADCVSDSLYAGIPVRSMHVLDDTGHAGPLLWAPNMISSQGFAKGLQVPEL